MSESHARVEAALELREPDRVPTFGLILEYSMVNRVLGKKPDVLAFLFRGRNTAKVLDRVLPRMKGQMLFDHEREGFAYLCTGASIELGFDSAWVTYYPNIRFLDSRTMVDCFGRLSEIVIEEDGNIGNPIYREGLIKSPADWDAWDKREIFRLPDKANRVFKGLREKYGERTYLFGMSSYGVFENTWQCMGFDRFVIAARRERDFIRRMICFYTDMFCLLAEAMGDAGLPAMVYTDDFGHASGPMLSPGMIDELFGEPYRRITGAAHRAGMKILMHSCGNVEPLLGWFADCGFDAVHPIEPTAGMDLARATEAVGGRMCLVGNIDVTRVLVDASREEVFAEVRRAIEDAGRGGGYILAPDHSHYRVSVERLRWMLEAVEEFGNYPLPGE